VKRERWTARKPFQRFSPKALIVNLVFFILWMVMKPFVLSHIGPAFTALLFWGFGVWVAHWLQCWNEITQALDPSVSFKYGSWQSFVRNSRRDFRYFWHGVMFSWDGDFIAFFSENSICLPWII